MKTKQEILKLRETAEQIDLLLSHIEKQDSLSTIDKDLLLQKIRGLYEDVLLFQAGEFSVAIKEEISAPIEEENEIIEEEKPAPEIEPDVKKEPIITEEIKPIVEEIIVEETVVEEIHEEKIPIEKAVEEEIAEKIEPEILEEVKEIVVQEVKAEEIPSTVVNEPQKISSRLESDLFSEIDDKSINQKIASENADESIGQRLQQKKIENLKSAIGINDKFLMMNELFGGRLDAYTDAINLLDAQSDYDQARDAFMNLGSQYKWETDNRAAEILMNFIERRHF